MSKDPEDDLLHKAIWRLEGVKTCVQELEEHFEQYQIELLNEVIDVALGRIRVKRDRERNKPKPMVAKKWSDQK